MKDLSDLHIAAVESGEPEMFKTTDASFQAASSSPSPRKPENTGMNAEPKAPAITTRKRRSGMRNAETYALNASDVPN